MGNEAATTFCTNRKKKSCSYPSPHLTFIKRHKEWKKGTVLHFTMLFTKLRFFFITKQILKCRETVRTQVKKKRVTVISKEAAYL